jgi:hypothetical protein
MVSTFIPHAVPFFTRRQDRAKLRAGPRIGKSGNLARSGPRKYVRSGVFVACCPLAMRS